jgi:hypothetical protein
VNRIAGTILAGALASACALQAQSVAPLISEQKAAYTAIKNNLVRAAEKMPEENYSFKPVPEIRSFGELMAHLAGQVRTCATINGAPRQVDANKTAKADVIALLKTAFAECDAAWDKMNEKTALETVAGRGGQQSTKLGMLMRMTVMHNNEEYGYAAVYLRLKGIVPPSSER